jgi:hypothetical protein
VSKSRCRYPFLVFTRSGLVVPNGAPHNPSASAAINASMNVDSNERSRSGDADSSCSCNIRAGSILGFAAIAYSNESTW